MGRVYRWSWCLHQGRCLLHPHHTVVGLHHACPLCLPGVMESCPAGAHGCRALGQDSGGINTIQSQVTVPEQRPVGAISSHQLPPEKKMNVSLWRTRAPDLQEPVAGAACSYRKET